MDFWFKQTSDKPLFEDIEWSRPQNKNFAGKLLIIGGNAHGFAAVGEAYQAATQAGVGSIRLLLPDVLKKTVGQGLLEAEYAPSTASGAFSQKALEPALDLASWADAVLITGDIGRSSETAIFLEKFAFKHSGPLTITKDALDFFTKDPRQLLQREKTLLVGSLAQVQKIAAKNQPPTVLKYKMDLLQLVSALNLLSKASVASLVTYHQNVLVVASGGKVSTTKVEFKPEDVWRVKAAAKATVYWLQNPGKPFEAVTTSFLAL